MHLSGSVAPTEDLEPVEAELTPQGLFTLDYIAPPPELLPPLGVPQLQSGVCGSE